VLVASVLSIGRPAVADAPVRLRHDVVYGVHGGVDLYLDAYLPADHEMHPAVILIHGGRWSYGDKQDLAPLAFEFVQGGFAAFSINYRLLPEWPYPAAVDDAKAAVAWVRTNARELGVDPRRIGALGGSAGGYLAAALATFGQGPLTTGSRVAVAASWSGPMDLEALLPIEEGRVGSTIAAFLGCRDPDSCVPSARAASPARHVDAGDAPLFIADALQEAIPVTQATMMAEACERARIPYELVRPEGSGHGMANAAELIEPTLHFFRRWLEPSATHPVGTGGDGERSMGDVEGAASAVLHPAPSTKASRNPRGWEPISLLLACLALLLVATASLQLIVVMRTRIRRR
jgi:acetyl esterase/lipase